MGTMYEDKFVKVTDEGVEIKEYTFMKKSRFVSFEEIGKLVVKKATLWNGRYRTLGTGEFFIWFAYDDRRFQRDCLFFMTVKNKYWRIGFSVEDPEVFTRIMTYKCRVVDRYFTRKDAFR